VQQQVVWHDYQVAGVPAPEPGAEGDAVVAFGDDEEDLVPAGTEVSAARALLAHYNTAMASRLARFVMEKASAESQEAVAGAALELVEKAAEKVLWDALLGIVRTASERYVATVEFKAIVDKQVAEFANKWLYQALETVANEAVRKFSRSAHMESFMAMVPGRLMAAIDKAVEAEAQLAMATAKDRGNT